MDCFVLHRKEDLYSSIYKSLKKCLLFSTIKYISLINTYNKIKESFMIEKDIKLY